MKKEDLAKHEFFKELDLSYAYDSLTNVFNRETIVSYIKYLVDRNIPFALGMCDVDNFKNVNDTYGHMTGDAVLSKVAQIVDECAGENGVVGRFGGDEFMVVLEDAFEYNDIWNVFHSINKTVSKANIDDNDSIFITITSGISRFPTDGTTYNEVLATADKALYRGKMKGRNCFIIYLAAKHANIVLTDGAESGFSLQLGVARAFDIVNTPKPMQQNVNGLLQYCGSSMMLDHISIMANDRFYGQKIHQLSVIKNFKPINPALIRDQMNSTGLFFVNQIKSLRVSSGMSLYEELRAQDIKSSLCVDIKAGKNVYGILRVDMTSTGRVWQKDEVNFILFIGRLIGTILATMKISIEDLFKEN